MHIVELYKDKDIYQVCDKDNNVMFQGSETHCLVFKHFKEKEYENLKNNKR